MPEEDTKSDRFLLKLLAIIGVPLLGAPVAICFNTFDWLRGTWAGQWYNETVNSVEVLFWLILLCVYYLVVSVALLHRFRKAEKNLKDFLIEARNIKTELGGQKEELTKSIKVFTDQLNRMEQAGIGAVEVCIQFLNRMHKHRIFDPPLWADLAKQEKDLLLDGFESVGSLMGAWSDRIIRSHDKEKGKKAYLTNTWLNYMTTYSREEAFDVRRGEVVTNGRNYPFLLIATLASLYKRMPKGSYLHYYSTTPVNPKDWYAWPHGTTAPKCYHEANFMSLFHRSLQEFILWSKQNDSRLVHARFILTRAHHVKPHVLGWPLDDFDNLKQDLCKCHLINAAIPLSEFQGRPMAIIKNYYQRLLNELHASEDSLYVVPLYGCHWDERLGLLISHLSRSEQDKQVPMGSVSETKQHLKGLKSAISTIKLVVNGDNTARQVGMQDLIKNAEGTLSKSWSNLLEKLSSDDISSCIRNSMDKKGECDDFPTLIQDFHRASLALVTKTDSKEDLVERTLLALLRYRALAVHNQNPSEFRKLGEIFSEQLHSEPRNAFVVRLDSKDGRSQASSTSDAFRIENWMSGRTEPEFAIFGVSRSSECSVEAFGKVNWKLAIATDISYPFIAAKIRIIDEDSELKHYLDVTGELLGGLNQNTYRVVDLL